MAESTAETDNSSDIQLNLRDLLATNLSRFPEPRDKRIASQTTDRPARRFLYKPGKSEKMVGLIYYPSLLDESLRLSGDLAEKIALDTTNALDIVFMTFISPELTSSFCSPELFSEHDSREYCGASLIRPALAAMHLVRNGGIPKTFKCTDSNTDAYVTSGYRKKDSPIADNLLIKGPYSGVENDAPTGENYEDKTQEDEDEDGYQNVALVDELNEDETDEEGRDEVSLNQEEQNRDDALLLGTIPEILMTMEMKTSTSLTERTFSDVVRFKRLEPFRNSAYLIRYVWPEVKGQKIKTCGKLVAQVYEHLYHNNKTEYAWLSSYDVNIFFYMKRGTNILYMSDQYTRKTMTPLHVFAWFCRANGLLGGGLDVPPPDYSYFNLRSDKNPNYVGLMTDLMYDELSAKPPETPTTPELVRNDANLPRTPKRGRSDVSEDVLSDNETTPRQRDFKDMKRRKQKP